MIKNHQPVSSPRSPSPWFRPSNGVFLVFLWGLCLAWPAFGQFQPPTGSLSDLPLVDIHSHIYRGEQDFFELVAFQKRNNICLMGISALTWTDADRQSLDLAERFPDRFLPFLRGFDPTWDHAYEYVKNRLEKDAFNGIGELFINGHGHVIPGDHPTLMRIYRLAGEKRVPVLFHWTLGSLRERERGTREGFQQLKRVLYTHPNTTFILAHAGRGPLPTRENYEFVLEHLMKEYDNLVLDLSDLHNDLFADDGSLTKLGSFLRRLCVAYPRRILLAFDIGDPGCLFHQADRVVRLWRHFLKQLPLDIAQKIGAENAHTLMGPSRVNNIAKKKPRPLAMENKISESEFYFDP